VDRAAEPGGDPVSSASQPWRAEERKHRLESGYGQQPEVERDLPAQPTAAHQDQALAALRELIRELHGHAAPERLADDGGPLVPERVQQVAQRVGMGAERVLVTGLVGLPLPEQIGGQAREPLGQRRHDVPPRHGATGHAVHDQQHRPLAGDSVGDPVAIDGDRTRLHQRPTRFV